MNNVACVNLQVFGAKLLSISSFRDTTPPHGAIAFGRFEEHVTLIFKC